jgi:hypothetical protein
MNVLYYHVYLNDDPGVWSSIVLEQLKCIEDYDLLQNLDKIKVTAITQYDSRMQSFEQLCKSYSDKFDIEFVYNPWHNDQAMVQNIERSETVTENYTYRKIYKDCQGKQDFNVCYIHTKGATSTLRHLNGSNPLQFKNYYYWRQYMNWGVLQNWKACVYALETGFDVAGVNYYENPSRHYSGNFWWAKSSYIKNLPDPSTIDWWREMQQKTDNNWLKTTSDRFKDEQWLCSLENVKAFNYFTLPESMNPAGRFLPTVRYKG